MATRRRVLWMSKAVGLLLGAATLGLSIGVGCGGAGEPRILDLKPRKGNTTGDQAVKIIGENFRADIGYTVYFGNKRSPSVTILDPQNILVVTPNRDDEGDVDITIRGDDGSAWRLEKAFHYESPAAAPINPETGGPTKGRY